jgi:hypothetical protein
VCSKVSSLNNVKEKSPAGLFSIKECFQMSFANSISVYKDSR